MSSKKGYVEATMHGEPLISKSLEMVILGPYHFLM
jgi:hypothetical protein